MTRENKLALVIGFGLLLLAGIFVSDHLSAQQRTDEEPLVASDERRLPDANILAPKRVQPSAVSQPKTLAASQTSAAAPTTKPSIPEIVIGTRASSQPKPSNLRIHYVGKGETLIAIARTYYGDADQARFIAEQNNIRNPNRLVVGTRLVLPQKTSVVVTNTPKPTPTAPKKTARTKVTVLEGDTLGKISKRAFGTVKRWPEIAAINKDVLPNPDSLRPGMTLRLPSP